MKPARKKSKTKWWIETQQVHEGPPELCLRGTWERDDEPPEWETFHLRLFGHEAEDTLVPWGEVRRVLNAAGLRLIRADTGEDV